MLQSKVLLLYRFSFPNKTETLSLGKVFFLLIGLGKDWFLFPGLSKVVSSLATSLII
jgi:hypothetical protein